MLKHHQTTGTICHLRPKWNSLCRHVAIWGSLRSGSWHPTVKGKFALVMHHEPGRSQGMLHPSDRKKKSTKKWWLQNAQGVQKWIYGYQWLYIKWIKMMAFKKKWWLENDPEQSSSVVRRVLNFNHRKNVASMHWLRPASARCWEHPEFPGSLNLVAAW